MKKIKKLVSLLLAMFITVGVIAAAPISAGADITPYGASGKCGTDDSSNLEWFAFDDGSMVIFGTGDMRNYHLENGISSAPWYGTDLSVIGATIMETKIAVEYGVTHIGDYSFYVGDSYPYTYFIQLKNVDIANTVTSIGKYAFYNQKMQEIIIPPSVTRIGENAFKNCRSLRKISYFGDPSALLWETDGPGDTEFPNGMTCHLLKTFAGRVSEFNTMFAYKRITFVADMENPYGEAGEDLDRNIALYYGTSNSGVFAGAAPYIIVGRFNGKKKSVTYGSNGFASCVKYGSDYYMLTDITTGELHEVNYNSTTGKAEGYESAALSGLKLLITHEYVGTNTVKVKYKLTNTTGSTINGLQVGGTGDIKIGADDFASIEPLNESGSQVGFYMKSTKEYDQSGDDYATLGFIGQNVKINPKGESTAANLYPNANYFYGTVSTANSSSAAGAKTVVLIPERIFSKNEGISQETGKYTGGSGKDSGMSYYWDIASLASNETKELAVLFSVYGTNDTEGSANTMITDLAQTYHTVTWKNYDGSVLLKSSVKDGDTPEYTGATPFKTDTESEEFTFSGWSPAVGAVTGDTEYIAQFSSTPRYLFKKHGLSLTGDIGVIYYIDPLKASVSKEAIQSKTKRIKISYSWYDKSSEFIIDDNAEYDSVENCFKAKCMVNAAEMAYDIHATAFVDSGDGNWVEYTGEYDIFSVREYGKVVLDPNSAFSTAYRTADEAKYDKLVDLVIAMLDYGAKAQLAFDRKTGDLANNIFPDYTASSGYSMGSRTAQQVGDATTAESDMDAGLEDIGLVYEGSSVVFLSNTSLRHYYTVADDTKFTEAVRSGASGFTYHDKDHGFYYEYAGIPAAELDEAKTFRLNGRDYVYSVLDYCRILLESDLPQVDKDLAIATYWYNQKANAFFD